MLRRLRTNLALLWQNRLDLLRAYRPVLVAYTWHSVFVALLTYILGDFITAAVAWLLLCNAGRDASIAYGLINGRQY
ncbi:hypothetical protein [Mesorhizobium sp. B2-1-2]|uniref:hypothetical protein n=1 Tax=Mesorhizobium sp. B2-1-2 TaxID=2589973 RepID=UPI00112765A4|nr:hypothetical protein [Mesorhizobium sp. B2-1-2]TPN04517.1 hypothetical protein FJ971_29670 [Mesorhizobium sp. B2-1-2]